MIIEYKMNRNEKGKLIVPPWIQDCGYFYNPSDHTYIGFSNSEPHREFYIPDTVTILTVEELKARIERIGMRNPETGKTLNTTEKHTLVDMVVEQHDLP